MWIDEIEKAFSGVNGQSDAVLTRMFGNFLSWMQEKTSTVYVIATANNADALPPELKRKDCMKGYSFEKDLNRFAKETNGFNGADIEAVVHDAVEKCFLNGTNGLNSKDILEIAKRTVCITKSCKKQIDAMQKVFSESSFRDATTGKITNAKSVN